MRVKRRKTSLGLVAGAALTVALAACGSGSGAQEDVGELEAEDEVVAELDSLYQAALDAGQTEVVVYQATPIDDAAVWDVFRARYPEIELTTATLFGAEFVSKIEQETTSGNVIADVVIQGASSVAPQAAQGGVWAEYTPVGSDSVPDIGRDPGLEGSCIAPFGDAAVIAYNTDVVPEDEAPQSWDDLVDPRWQGRFVIEALDVPSTASRTFALLKETGVIDDAWLQALVDQDLVFVASSAQVGGALTSGQGDIGIGRTTYLVPEIERGAPIGITYPIDGGSTMSANFTCTLEDAPHPEAAQLMMTWLFTDEAQEGLSSLGYYPFVPGNAPAEGFPPIEEIDNFVAVPAADEPGLIAAMTQQMGTLLN